MTYAGCESSEIVGIIKSDLLKMSVAFIYAAVAAAYKAASPAEYDNGTYCGGAACKLFVTGVEHMEYALGHGSKMKGFGQIHSLKMLFEIPDHKTGCDFSVVESAHTVADRTENKRLAVKHHMTKTQRILINRSEISFPDKIRDIIHWNSLTE